MKDVIALKYKNNDDMILIQFSHSFHRMYSRDEFESILEVWDSYDSFAGLTDEYIYLIPSEELKHFDVIE